MTALLFLAFLLPSACSEADPDDGSADLAKTEGDDSSDDEAGAAGDGAGKGEGEPPCPQGTRSADGECHPSQEEESAAVPPEEDRAECGPLAVDRACERGVCVDQRCVEPDHCDRISHCMGDRLCVGGQCANPCVTHGDCADDEECTDAICGPPAAHECDADRSCAGRHVCHSTLNVCVEPALCRNDSDCDVTRWGTRRCEEERKRCVYCVDDMDCPVGRTCGLHEGAGESICLEPDSCADHASCLSARRCDTDSGACVFEGGCVDDSREPNDSLDQARNNPRSHLAEARYTGLSLCQGGEDWYRIRVPPGRGLQATLRYLAPFDELDLAIWDEDGTLLTRGEGPPNDERAALPGDLPGGGFRYLQVTSRRGGSNEYKLEVDLPDCVDDLGEEDDGPEAARPLGEGGFQGWICGPDVDWYRLDVPAQTQVHIELLHGAGFGELTLSWTARPDAAGAERLGEPLAGGSVLRAVTDSMGSRWLAVGSDENVSIAYRLEVSYLPLDCDDDAREENDGRLTASELAKGANRLLKACPGDTDWHWIRVEEGDGLEVRLTSDQEGEPSARLFAPRDGAKAPILLASPDPQDGALRIGRAERTGRYLIRATSSLQTDYRLDVTVIPGGFCLNDALETNDDVGQEALLRTGVHALILCPGDKDRFAIHVDEGSVLDVAVVYDPEAHGGERTGIALAVFDPEGRVFGESAEGDGTESVRGLARLSGIFTMRVGRIRGEQEIAYELSAWVEPVNDRCDSPIPLSDGQVIRASTTRARDDRRGSCGGSGPDVMYSLELEQPSGIEVRLTPADGVFPGALHLRTVCEDLTTEVACERDAEADGTIVLRVPFLRGGLYHLIVDSVDSRRGGNFELSARVVRGGICFPDESEPDDGPDEAAAVGEGRVDDRSLCQGDEDWLVVDVPVDHDLVVAGHPVGDAGAMDMAVFSPEGGDPIAGPAELPRSLRIDTRVSGAGPRLIRLRGGPGDYAIDVAFVAHHAPEDSCLDPPLLAPDLRVAGDTSRLHDFSQGGACGNPVDAGGVAAPSPAPEAVYRVHLDRQSSIKATVSGEFDRVVYLRAACDDPGTELQCVDDWIDSPEVLQLPHLDAGDYFLFVDGFGAANASGPYEVTLAVREPYFPPDNDTCETAAPLPVGVEIHGTTRLAEDDYSSTCTRRRGHAAADVVYRFTLDSLTRVRLTLDASGQEGEEAEFDSVLYLRRDCRNDSPPIECIDQPEPQVIDAFLGAGDYFVVVDGWREGEGDFRLLLETFEPQ